MSQNNLSRRLTVRFAVLSSGLVLTSLMLALFFLIASLYQSEKNELRELSATINSSVAPLFQNGIPHKNILHTKLTPLLQNLQKLRDDETFNMHFAVYATKSNKLLFSTDTTQSLTTTDHLQPFQLQVSFTSYDSWNFMYRIDNDSYYIITQSKHIIKIIHTFLVACALSLLLALFLAWLTGKWFSRIIAEPFEHIRRTTEQIRQGSFQSRIPLPLCDDEIADVISDLNATFEELEVSFTKIKTFSGGAAHELKTPLTALRGNMEVCLRSTRSTEEYQQTILEALEELHGLGKIIDTLLLLSKSSSTLLRDEGVPCDIAKEVGDVIDVYHPLFEDKGVQLHFTTEAPPSIIAIPHLIRQACMNILRNALEHTPPEHDVFVSVSSSEKNIHIKIQDTGNGFDPKHCQRLTEPFYQVETTLHNGAGLGLALVKWIVVTHGGRLECSSTVGKGATFIMTLPLTKTF